MIYHNMYIYLEYFFFRVTIVILYFVIKNFISISNNWNIKKCKLMNKRTRSPLKFTTTQGYTKDIPFFFPNFWQFEISFSLKLKFRRDSIDKTNTQWRITYRNSNSNFYSVNPVTAFTILVSGCAAKNL